MKAQASWAHLVSIYNGQSLVAKFSVLNGSGCTWQSEHHRMSVRVDPLYDLTAAAVQKPDSPKRKRKRA
jgi:hypothetical protein